MDNPAFWAVDKKDFWYKVDDPQFMDVIFIDSYHVGVILNKNEFIHAAQTVQIGKIKTLLKQYKVYRYGFSIL